MKPVAAPLIDAEVDDSGVQPPRGFNPLWLLLGMFLVGLNLRPALSSVAPVLGSIRDGLGLSAAAAGVLTTLPVLCLGLFAPLAPRLARRWGAERVILGALLALAVALLLRASGQIATLYAGTVLAGAANRMRDFSWKRSNPSSTRPTVRCRTASIHPLAGRRLAA